MQGARVRSLVGELRSRMPRGEAKKKKDSERDQHSSLISLNQWVLGWLQVSWLLAFISWFLSEPPVFLSSRRLHGDRISQNFCWQVVRSCGPSPGDAEFLALSPKHSAGQVTYLPRDLVSPLMEHAHSSQSPPRLSRRTSGHSWLSA